MTTNDAPPLSRRERKKRETRLRILEAALILMGERGYDAVKVEDIAKRADVANATFFLHFPTKASLITAFNEMVTDKIVDRLQGFDLPAIEKLELARALVLDEWAQHSNMMRSIVVDAARYGDSFDADDSLARLIGDIVKEGQESGDFALEYDPKIVADCLMAGWRAASLQWATTGDDERARQANRQALDMILFGISARR